MPFSRKVFFSTCSDIAALLPTELLELDSEMDISIAKLVVQTAAKLAVHLAAAKLSCRLWFEWVPTDMNCSDGLSRDGILDSWSLQQDWNLQVWKPPRMLDVVCRSLVEFAKEL